MKFKIIQQNGRIYILRAKAEPKLNNKYSLWYRGNRFWHKWQFVCIIEEQKNIEQVIYYHFGFTTVIKRQS